MHLRRDHRNRADIAADRGPTAAGGIGPIEHVGRNEQQAAGGSHRGQELERRACHESAGRHLRIAAGRTAIEGTHDVRQVALRIAGLEHDRRRVLIECIHEAVAAGEGEVPDQARAPARGAVVLGAAEDDVGVGRIDGDVVELGDVDVRVHVQERAATVVAAPDAAIAADPETVRVGGRVAHDVGILMHGLGRAPGAGQRREADPGIGRAGHADRA